MITSIFLTGVGGQGVVTMANLITAHLERRGMKVTLIHATGMAQRGGRVTSEIRFSDDRSADFGPRISEAGADYMIGMDMAETINSAGFIKPSGSLIYNEYTLIPSGVVLKKEHFPDSGEVREIFQGICRKTVAVENPPSPVNMFILGVFVTVCENGGGAVTSGDFEETLKTALTKRMDENLSAFRQGVARGKAL